MSPEKRKRLLRQRKRLVKLLRRWTRYEVVSRLSPVGFPIYGEASRKKFIVEDKIRKLLYGTSDLVTIGQRLGLVPTEKHKKHKKHKKE